MYGDIFDEELAKKSVFEDQSKLFPDYVPEELVHREEEFRELIQFFKPLLEDKASQRVLINGPVGVGKTALTLKFGQELQEAAKKRDIDLTYTHVNCRKQGTPQMVIRKVAESFPMSVPRRGFAPQELMGQAIDYLEKKDSYLAVALDELDYFVRQNGPDLLYSLTRAAEESEAPNRLSIIATSHSPDFLDTVDEATRSTFMHNLVELDKYSSSQLRDILNQRVELAFKPGTVGDETIELISDISARRGDARFAFEILWHAGKFASQGEVEEVLPNHARKAKAEVHPGVRRDVLADLKKHELLTLLAIGRKLKISNSAYVLTGEVEEAYQVVCEEFGEEPRGHTSFWKYINNLDSLGIVDTQESVEGHRGKSKKISVSDAPPEMMEEAIAKILKSS